MTETLNYFNVKFISYAYACMYIKFLLTKLRDGVELVFYIRVLCELLYSQYLEL